VTRIEPAPAEDIDAGVPIDGGGGAVVVRPPQGSNVEPTIDAGPVLVAPVDGTISVTVAGAQWRRPGEDWQRLGETEKTIHVKIDAPTTIEVKHECCEEVSVTLDRTNTSAVASLQFRAASVKPTCAAKNVFVAIEWTYLGKPRKATVKVAEPFSIPFDKNTSASTKEITVTFTDADHPDRPPDVQQHTVNAGKPTEVACKLAP
jgi:hypothetical protein